MAAKRTTKGTFVKGVSGNPKGRTKGSRNNITLRRLETEESLRDFVAPHAKAILRKAIAMAIDGDQQMLKLLLDKMMSTLRNEDVGESRDTEIKVQINNLTVAKDKAALVATAKVVTDAEIVSPALLSSP